MSPSFDPEGLSTLWRERRPGCPPVAHAFKETYRDCWVRFHGLPGSKRYPDSEDEYETVLGRYNAVLDALFADVDVYVVTADWSPAPTGPAFHPARGVLHPDGVRWWTIPNASDPDPEFHNYDHLYASRESWRPGCIDQILRAVADDVLAGVFVTDLQLRRIHHPYDGGADAILADPDERELLRDRHVDWLSRHPAGL